MDVHRELILIIFLAENNVALRGVAAQSSQFSDRDAHYAIDGYRNTNYGSCTHTAQDTNPWWRVDLLDVYKVTAVTITNRDEVPERLDGAEIRIGNSLENNDVLSSPTSQQERPTPSSVMRWRVAMLLWSSLSGRNISLCVSWKYTGLLQVIICHLNVALKGVASQSSLNGYGNAHNAIDGSRESDYYKRSCTHTTQETNPWWRVDLLDVTKVTAVSITNRGDGVPERLDGAEMRIGNSLENNGINNPRCVVISHIPAGETNTFQCNEMEGRYVVVVIPGRSEWLTLCEVEVFATIKTPELSTEGTSFPVHLIILSVKVCRIITLMNILIFVSDFGLVEIMLY
uniref:Fucolectin tachylectin-4 pentraxin-1 domain-containing protein n=1 Tax=Hucho hucho TaxID=62062 RepID=A0A4W5JNT0_9TELE